MHSVVVYVCVFVHEVPEAAHQVEACARSWGATAEKVLLQTAQDDEVAAP
jgi:hypothetical protein